MSNGVFQQFREMVETGEILPSVSNRVIMAAIVELYKKEATNSGKIDDLETEVVVLKSSDRKWGGLTMAISTIGALFNANN